MIAIGVVNDGYDTSKMPGRKSGTVGYHTDGNIYDAKNHYLGRPTKGIEVYMWCYCPGEGSSEIIVDDV